jgi:trimeric autotransporter adhesin
MPTTVSGSYPAVNSDSDATINGLTVGKGGGAVSTNTAVGNATLGTNASGSEIAAFGIQALRVSTVSNNAAFGAYAMYNTTTGTESVSVGRRTLFNNTTGGNNVAVGDAALNTNTTGSTNVAVGGQALLLNTTASNNTAVGYQAGYSNTTGTIITAIGRQALYNNTTGTDNTALSYAMVSNTTGSYNTGLGNGALQSNTTASDNTAVGYQALYNNVTGTGLTAVGKGAALASTGNYNTIVGWRSGEAITSGAGNTIVGALAGSLSTGSKNTFIGGPVIGVTNGCASAMTTGSSNTIIGNYNGNQGGLDIRTSSNNIVLSDGDANVRIGYSSNTNSIFVNNTGSQFTQIDWFNNGTQKAAIWWDNTNLRLQTFTGATAGPYVANNGTSWTNSSDERLKNIIGEIKNGLQKVCTLRAAEYTWKSDVTAKPQVGLIAQDLLSVLPEAVDIPIEGATEKDGSPTMMGVQYNSVIPLLVAAIKELKAEVDSLKQQLGK